MNMPRYTDLTPEQQEQVKQQLVDIYGEDIAGKKKAGDIIASHLGQSALRDLPTGRDVRVTGSAQPHPSAQGPGMAPQKTMFQAPVGAQNIQDILYGQFRQLSTQAPAAPQAGFRGVERVGPTTGAAPMGAARIGTDLTALLQSQEGRAAQLDATQMARQAALGFAPSVAQLQAAQVAQGGLQAQLAAAASARGGGAAQMAAQREAAMAGAQITGQAARDIGQLRAAEMAQARQEYGGLTTQQRAQDLQALGMSADQALAQAQLEQQAAMQNQAMQQQAILQSQQLAQQAALTEAGLGVDVDLANLQAQMQQRGLTAQQQQAIMRELTGYGARQQQAGMSYEQMRLNTLMGLEQMRQQQAMAEQQRRTQLGAAGIGAAGALLGFVPGLFKGSGGAQSPANNLVIPDVPDVQLQYGNTFG